MREQAQPSSGANALELSTTLESWHPTYGIKVAAAVLGLQVTTSVLTQGSAELVYVKGAALALACILYLFVAIQTRQTHGRIVLVNVLAMLVVALGRGYADLAPTVAVGRTCVELPRRFAFAAAIVHTAFVAVVTAAYRGWKQVATSSLAMLAASAFVIAFVEVALRERRARAELSEANARLAEYAQQAEELARTKERNRLARELHDSMGHYLALAHVQIQVAESQVSGDPARLRASLAQSARLIHEGLEDVRHSVSALRTSPLEQLTLPDAIANLVAQVRASTGSEVSFDLRGSSRALPPAVDVTLYRTVQEGLNNARKHAAAQHVQVVLAFAPAHVELRISDDGRGAADDLKLGLGLLGLHERAQFVRGTLTISPTPGFALTLLIPMDEAQTN